MLAFELNRVDFGHRRYEPDQTIVVTAQRDTTSVVDHQQLWRPFSLFMLDYQDASESQHPNADAVNKMILAVEAGPERSKRI